MYFVGSRTYGLVELSIFCVEGPKAPIFVSRAELPVSLVAIVARFLFMYTVSLFARRSLASTRRNFAFFFANFIDPSVIL